MYFNDVPVGTICCRLETKGGSNQLYLMTMGILAVSQNQSDDNEENFSHPFEAVPIERRRFTMSRVGRGCRCRSNETQNQSGLSPCPDIQRSGQSFLRTAWLRGGRCSQKLLQEDCTPRRMDSGACDHHRCRTERKIGTRFTAQSNYNNGTRLSLLVDLVRV